MSAPPIGRAAAELVKDALADTPVVLIHGPRQAGKTTLAQSVASELGAFRSISLDDPFSLAFAKDDPTEFISSHTGSVLIDEVQRAPEIFLPMKAMVDRDRRTGRFLLTGSSNILALPKLADSLAGRMAIVDLLPLSQAEIEGHSSSFLDAAFGSSPIDYSTANYRDEDLFDRIVRGGFPEIRTRASEARRAAWFTDYVRTILERDVRDIKEIEGISQLPKVLRMIAGHSGSSLNVAGISRDTGLPSSTLHRYLDLLQGVFLIHLVPAWSSDNAVRLTKAAKAYLVDSGLFGYVENLTASSLARDRSRLGPILENFVAMELKKLALLSSLQPVVHHLRTVRQLAVDLVLEARGGDIVGIEIKPSATVQAADIEGLKYLKALAPDKFRRGIVLYTGTESKPLAADIVAVPIDALWRL